MTGGSRNRVLLGGPVNDKTKPWLALRDGETELQWHIRMSKTCWRCGHFETDSKTLDKHEQEHS